MPLMDGGVSTLGFLGLIRPFKADLSDEEVSRLERTVVTKLERIQKGLEQISTCSWPRRIWVVQEAHAAPNGQGDSRSASA